MCQYLTSLIFFLFYIYTWLIFWILFMITYDTDQLSANVKTQLRYVMLLCAVYIFGYSVSKLRKVLKVD
jgi:hypothetical protein